MCICRWLPTLSQSISSSSRISRLTTGWMLRWLSSQRSTLAMILGSRCSSSASLDTSRRKSSIRRSSYRKWTKSSSYRSIHTLWKFCRAPTSTLASHGGSASLLTPPNPPEAKSSLARRCLLKRVLGKDLVSSHMRKRWRDSWVRLLAESKWGMRLTLTPLRKMWMQTLNRVQLIKL